MKKLISFFGLCFYIVGALGGFGYACYCHKYFIAVCVAVLAVLAFPKAKAFYNELTH